MTLLHFHEADFSFILSERKAHKGNEHAEKYVKVEVTRTRKVKHPLVSYSSHCSIIPPITFYWGEKRHLELISPCVTFYMWTFGNKK